MEELAEGGAASLPSHVQPVRQFGYLLAGGFAPFLGRGEGRLILPLSPVLQQESLAPLPPLLFWASLLHGL